MRTPRMAIHMRPPRDRGRLAHVQDGWVFLYRDGETDRVSDIGDYLRRVSRLIAAGTGENAIIYAGRLLSTLPKK
jgi:hypothetical protein